LHGFYFSGRARERKGIAQLASPRWTATACTGGLVGALGEYFFVGTGGLRRNVA
jgi:hypothetical protein